MYEQVTFLKFADCEQLAVLGDCSDLLPLIRSIMPGWPVETVSISEEMPVPFLEIGKVDGKFLLMMENAEKPIWYEDPVDAVCGAIVELAWETLRTNPQLLCLHCAAINVSGRLLVFPAIYKSGKSTLTACMAHLGHEVFTDDFLSLEAQNGSLYGLAGGVGLRMRRPWPGFLSDELQNWLESTQSEASARYSYHGGEGVRLAERGTRALPGAFILPERMENGEAELTAVEAANVLQTIVKQNFSRAVNAKYILKALHYLASSIPSYKLRFSDPEAAAALLSKEFQKWPDEAARDFQPPDLGNTKTVPIRQALVNRIDGSSVFMKGPNVAEHDIDGVHFLADGKGFGVFKLDQISSAIWRLIDEPMSIADIIEIFHAAFPGKQKTEIRDDIANLFADLLDAGLVDLHDDAPQEQTGQAAAHG